MENLFVDKVVLITGAASGFGALLAKSLAQRGCKLVLGDLNLDGCQTVAQTLADQGTQVVYQHCDVTDESACEDLVKLAVDSFGRLDMACNNAGMSTAIRPLIEMTEKDFDLNFAVNTKGVFFGMKYQIQQMLTQGSGIILNVASMAGLGAAPKLAPYCAAKHAVVGLTKTAAVEYGRKNIRCNAICPYFSPTPLIADTPFEDDDSPFAQASPMKRLGQPQEIVNTMVSLLSPENSYLNGQTLAVDGGILAM
ncbi:SDR family NAD(P)-dependent oxidoreductase [Halioxenophilus aromaticivorans]|uniref:Glucose 1-dehydrogenase n=1 Tax=Halioxenophilus aromaticivorans TaxID=1306992 RepID=A0AAV3U2F5_9ALTE